MATAAQVPSDLTSRFQAIAGANPAPGATPKPPQAAATPPPGPSDDLMARFGKVAQDGSSATQQQEQQQPEDTDFFSRAYQTSPVKGVVESAKAAYDEMANAREQEADVQKQAMQFIKSGDYGRAADILLSHLGSPGFHPYQIAKNLVSSTVEHGKKAIEEGKKGNVGEAIVQGAEAIPVVGPLAGSIGEPLGKDLKEGNYEGAAGDVVGGAASIGPLLLGKEAGAASDEPGLVRPGKVEVAGEKIPIRASAQEGTKGTVAGTAEYTADSGNLKKFDVEKTQPAARKAASNVASEAADTSRATTTPAKEDAFGFGKASDELQARSKTVFKKLDDLSDRAFSEAQEDAANARQDYTAQGRQAYREALDRQDELFNRYESEFEPGALAKAKVDWAKSQGLEDLRVRFNRSVHPTPVELTKTGETDIGYVNGKTFRESITDALQKDKYGKNEFERAGFTPQHIQTIEEIGRILEKGNNLHRINPIVKQATAVLSAGTTKVAEFAGGHIMGKIMTTPATASVLLKGLKSSASAATIANALRPYLKEEKKEP